MFFQLFQSGSSLHLKRAATLLQEAQMARLEHQAAAEHHAALAKMYADRVKRLTHEVYPLPAPGVDPDARAEQEKPAIYSIETSRRPKSNLLT
ncbi:hypothetical protein [Variovorax sp. CCNWLW235]|jgi:hypothetical protein|uniref:hypothetical protein n=1 Tax=Variovorax sp. CCNWLW235 TaxID=3127463 RepID=UPI003078A29B